MFAECSKLKEIAVHVPCYEAGLNKVIDPTVRKGWQIDPSLAVFLLLNAV